jgi:hypothetical protein
MRIYGTEMLLVNISTIIPLSLLAVTMLFRFIFSPCRLHNRLGVFLSSHRGYNSLFQHRVFP